MCAEVLVSRQEAATHAEKVISKKKGNKAKEGEREREKWWKKKED